MVRNNVKVEINKEIAEIVDKYIAVVKENYNVVAIILFGSYAKNESTEQSDIDILIDSNGKIRGLKYFAIIDMIKQKFGKEVDVIEKIEIERNSKIEKEIERTGVVVYEK